MTVAVLLVFDIVWIYLWWKLLYSRKYGKDKWNLVGNTNTGKLKYVNPATAKDTNPETLEIDPLLLNPVMAGLILVAIPALLTGAAVINYKVTHRYKQMAAIRGATEIVSRVL